MTLLVAGSTFQPAPPRPDLSSPFLEFLESIFGCCGGAGRKKKCDSVDKGTKFDEFAFAELVEEDQSITGREKEKLEISTCVVVDQEDTDLDNTLIALEAVEELLALYNINQPQEKIRCTFSETTTTSTTRMDVTSLNDRHQKENSCPPGVVYTPPSVKMHGKSAVFNAKHAGGTENFKRQLFKHDDSISKLVNGDAPGTPGTPERADPATPQRLEDKENALTPRTGNNGSALRPSSARRLQHLNETEKLIALEEENIRLRDALKGLKTLMANQAQLVVSSAAIVEGAKKYVHEKALSAQKLTPQQRRYGSAVTVKIVGAEIVGNHVEYKLEVRFGDEGGHTVQKRFSEFLGLRQRVLIAAENAARSEATCSLFWGYGADEVNIQTLKLLRDISLPKKRWFSNLEDSVIEERKESLQDFLDAVMKACKRAGRGAEVRSVVSDWLGIHRNDEDSVWCDDRIKPLAEFDTRSRQARVSEAFESILSQTPVRKALIEQVAGTTEMSPYTRKPTRSATELEDDLHVL